MARVKSEWAPVDKTHVSVTHIKGKPKKITGTRLGAILGLNEWKTPFQAWCEITRVAEPPFEGTKYTEAGKVIEPKLIEYCRDYVSPDLVLPEDRFGADYFQKTFGDFYPSNAVFGGMWDALYMVNGQVAGVIECKTSSRPQDWLHGVPKHYAVQGLLYAYLLGVEDVYFPVAFLSKDDYDHPELFECDEDNTALYHIKVTDDFIKQVKYAKEWWLKHIVDGAVSPEFDEKADAEYLKLMRTNEIVDVPDDIEELVARIRRNEEEIARIKLANNLDTLENENKVLTEKLKEYMLDMCSGEARTVNFHEWKLSKSIRRSVDTQALKKDGLYDKYTKESESYRLTKGKE